MDNNPSTKKSLGQHWLNDRASLEAMLEAADINENDIVLEIGPGPGSLTGLLAAKAKEVVAIELDETLAEALNDRVNAGNLSVVKGDILTYNLNQLPKGYKIAANIPYYLSSNLIRVLSESNNPPVKVALLVQKEVAERLSAKPGEMSILGVTAQFYWEVEPGPVVPATLFSPPPKVDSQIVSLTRRRTTLFPDAEPKEFFRVVKAGFSQKRKTLLNSLSGGLRLDKDTVKTACETVEIDPGRRAQTLSLEEWHNLYVSLNT